MDEKKKTKVEQTESRNDRFKEDDQIMYKNILDEWHEGTILKVNNTTIRILNTTKFKILSIKRENVLTMEEYQALLNTNSEI